MSLAPDRFHFAAFRGQPLPRDAYLKFMSIQNLQIKKEFRFVSIRPKILYFGTPVAIVSSRNEDGSINLAPISSFWALGWTMLLGLLRDTKTLKNMQREPDCVVSLPSPDLWEKVERLAPLTGLHPVPKEKAAKFHHTKNKFAAAGLTAIEGKMVSAPRVKECPAQLEARTKRVHWLQGDERFQALTGSAAVEVEILRVHMRNDYVLRDNYVDPAAGSRSFKLPTLLRTRPAAGEDIPLRDLGLFEKETFDRSTELLDSLSRRPAAVPRESHDELLPA